MYVKLTFSVRSIIFLYKNNKTSIMDTHYYYYCENKGFSQLIVMAAVLIRQKKNF